MHCHNLIPFMLTVPMGVVYYFFTTPDIRTISDAEFNSPTCNCTKPFRFKEAELDLNAKLTEINIPKQSRVDILNMLDNLEWVQVKPSCNTPRELSLDFVQQLLDNKLELLYLLLINSASFMIFHALAQNSIFGIMFKICITRSWDFAKHLQKSSSHVIQQSVIGMKKITTRAVTTDEDDSPAVEDDDEEEVFLQCSSTYVSGVENEQIHPKAKDREEKLDFCSSDDVSSIPEDPRPFVNAVSGVTVQDDVPTSEEISSDFSRPQSAELNSPEKFKKFLHQKHESVGKLGLANIDEDDKLAKRRRRHRMRERARARANM